MVDRVCKDCGIVNHEVTFKDHKCPECNSENTQSLLPTNKYGGRCGNCKEYVKPGEGWWTKSAGVNHHTCKFKTKSWKESNAFIAKLPLFGSYDPDN